MYTQDRKFSNRQVLGSGILLYNFLQNLSQYSSNFWETYGVRIYASRNVFARHFKKEGSLNKTLIYQVSHWVECGMECRLFLFYFTWKTSVEKKLHYHILITDTSFLLRFLRVEKFSQPEALRRLERYLEIFNSMEDWIRDIDMMDPEIQTFLDEG